MSMIASAPWQGVIAADDDTPGVPPTFDVEIVLAEDDTPGVPPMFDVEIVAV